MILNNKNFKEDNFFLVYAIISIFYAFYFFLIGSDNKDAVSIISFVRNDTFLFHEYAIEFKNNILSTPENLFNSKFNNRIMLSINIWLQGFTYFIYESLWSYLFVISFIVKIIHSLSLRIYCNYNDKNKLSVSIIILSFLIFFPSFVYTALVMGKDLYILLIILYFLYFITSKTTKDYKYLNYIFIFFITIQFILLRPSLLYAILILFLLIYLYSTMSNYFTKSGNLTNLTKNLGIVIGIITVGIISFEVFFSIEQIHSTIGSGKSDFDQVQSNVKGFFKNDSINNIRTINNSSIFPIFINEVCQLFHFVRENFNNHQFFTESSTSVYHTNYNDTFGLAKIIVFNTFHSIFSPLFLKIEDSSNLLFYLTYLESFIYFLLVTLIFIPYSKQVIEYKIFIFFYLGFFLSLVLFLFPNVGSFIRYKVFILPILLIFTLINIQNFLSKLEDNFIDKKLFLYKKYFFNSFLLIIMMISFVFRDFFIIKNLGVNETNRFIIYTSLLTVYLNIFNTVIIDLGASNNKKIVNIISILSIIILFLLTLFFTKSTDYLHESILISIIAISAIFNSNILAKNLNKFKKSFIFILNIFFNLSIILIFRFFDFYLLNVLIFILFVSIFLNIIFFTKNDFISENVKYDLQFKYLVNQALIIITFLLTIDLSISIFDGYPLSSYSIKLIYSILLGLFLSTKLILIPDYSKINYKLYFDNLFGYIVVFLLIIFSIFLLSLMSLNNFIKLENMTSFYALIIFIQILFYNLLCQKLIFFIKINFSIYVIGNTIPFLLLIYYSQINNNLSILEFIIMLCFSYSILPLLFIFKYFKKFIFNIFIINFITLSLFYNI